MSLLDVQHIKRFTKPAFKERRLKPLKDIHFTVERVSTWLLWGNQIREINSPHPSHAGPADGRAGLPK